MTLSRMKIMSGVLALSLGTLAVSASERTDKAAAQAKGNAPAPVCHTTDKTNTVSTCERHAAKPTNAIAAKPISTTAGNDFAIDLVLPDVPAAPVPVAKNPTETLKAEVPAPALDLELPKELAAPAKAASPEPLPEPASQPLAPLPPLDLEPIKAPVAMPQPAQAPLAPLPPVAAVPPVAPVAMPPVTPVTATAPIATPPAAPIPPAVITPARKIAAVPTSNITPATQANFGQLKLYVRMGMARPRFEIKRNDETVLKVYSERIDVQSPKANDLIQSIAGVSSYGRVHFIGPEFEGYCDQLNVASETGAISMKGNVRMKCKRGGTYSELTADTLQFTISGTRISANTEAKSGKSITPASYDNPTR
ncbi:hypothetical protein [Tuwongella immobilis]|uniref:Uncharacterized protein n=1 Tax=Tuwongella immobilis TaxID=692036 RepID=A0A6C2YKX2_9BACT|nr:hypothetical protein [Tuwongella immobilis]VIP01755.1 unnamed protein product [Tuwongella immobilis]VTR99352.1 unnamed protein product [Tuwongella immobilis]